jgi:sigma-B regulation protein RsbU (phosphoserine phosphatase)
MRVLIADDDRVMRHALGRKLASWDLEPLPCSDGLEVRQILLTPPLPAIAIIDWNMPGVDGLTLCREIRNLPDGGNIYLILITSNASRQDVLSGLTSGADDYVVKPFDWEELRARVRIGARTAMLQQKLADHVRELQAALSRLRVLDGLLPICSYCKSIRSDENYWEQLETYLSEHSDATFSHGICPSCFDLVKASYS